MAKAATQVLGRQSRVGDWATQALIVIGASVFVALCAQPSLRLPFTPVPLTLQNFAVLLVGLLLGWRRAFAAMVLYLAEGAAGLPVFSPGGLGGVAQLLGPTGGYLMAYPFVAALAGWMYGRSSRSFARAAVAALAAEILLFVGGLAWLAILFHSTSTAIKFGLYWFVFAEVIKIVMVAGIAERWNRRMSPREE
jgi:biotin transport system substrate-specific component